MTVASILNLAMYGIFALLLVIGVIAGLVRGVRRAAVRILTIVVSVVIAFLASMAIYPASASMLEGQTMEGILAKLSVPAEGLSMLTSVDTATVKYVMALPLALVAVPVAFVVIFVIVSGILIIAHKVLSGILGFRKNANSGLTRILGAVVGAVQAVIVCGVILLPAVGAISVVSDAVAVADERYADKNNAAVISAAYHENIAPVTENPIYRTVNLAGGGVYKKIATVKIDSTDYDMTDVIPGAMGVVAYMGDLAETDWANITDADKAAIDAMISSVEGSDYLLTVLSGVFRSVGASMQPENSGMVIDDAMKSFFDDYLAVISTTDKTTVSADMRTTVEVYGILCKAGVFSGQDAGGNDILDSFTKAGADGKTLYALLSEALSKNPRMSGISMKLSDAAVKLLINKSGLNSTSEEVIGNVKEGLNEALAIEEETYATPEEYKAAVSSVVKETLDSNGIGLNDSQLVQITEYVITDMGGVEDVSDEDIADFIVKYYDVYSGNSDEPAGEAGQPS